MIDGDTKSSSGQVYGDIADQRGITPGKSYTFSAWYKGKNIYLVIKWFDANGGQMNPMLQFWQPASTVWKQASTTVTAPQGAKHAWLFVQTRDNASTVYFDDLDFAEVK